MNYTRSGTCAIAYEFVGSGVGLKAPVTTAANDRGPAGGAVDTHRRFS